MATEGKALIVDPLNRAYITGRTYAHNFPTTSGTFQPEFGGEGDNIFVSVLSEDGASLVASTFIGTDSINYPADISLDSHSRVYITGVTDSENFPITPSIIPSSFKGIDDCFVCILSGNLSQMMVSFYLGGSGKDSAAGIALGAHNDVYITGNTYSGDFPVSFGAFQPQRNGYIEAFLARYIIQFADINRASLKLIKIG